MARILLIGGCGYIGSRLFQVLNKNYVVDSVDTEWYGNHVNDFNIIKDFGTITKKELSFYDVVILLAGHSSVKMCVDNMIPTLKNNVLNFANLLENLDKEQTFIYASSSSVYGDTKENIVTEEYNQFEPNNYYDLSKHEIDSYAKLSNTKYFGLRFGTVNGASPNLRNDIMINAMTFNAIKNGKVYCFNPEVHRPILGIEDLCAAISTIIQKGTYENRGFYNLASFNSTAEKISRIVAEQTGAELEIVDELPKTITNVKLQTKAYNFLIDSTLFEQTFDFEFKETIGSIVESLVKNFDNMNKGNRSDARMY
jgi:nucleoside-diphosphate-sugar epimerase